VQLTGKTVLITGGTAGIGVALARVLKGRSVKVLVCGRDRERLEALAREGFFTIRADVGTDEGRAAILDAVARSEFLDCRAPQGALYAFPGVDTQRLPGFDDEAFALDLLEREQIILVPGSSFNIPARNRFRVTLLPEGEGGARSGAG